jgi:hypothetical protein
MRGFMECFFSPRKYRRAITYGGTVDIPKVATRSDYMVRRYNTWHDEDGGYHEELIPNEEYMNPGGTS